MVPLQSTEGWWFLASWVSKKCLKEKRQAMGGYLCANPTETVEPEGIFRMGKEGYIRVWAPKQERLECELDSAVSVQFSLTLSNLISSQYAWDSIAWDSRAWYLTGKLTGTTLLIFQGFVIPPSSLSGATRLEEDTTSLLFDQYCFWQSDPKLVSGKWSWPCQFLKNSSRSILHIPNIGLNKRTNFKITATRKWSSCTVKAINNLKHQTKLY